jgi:serine/threonine-protein kinase RsbW
VDWCIDPAVDGSRHALEGDIAAYLHRRVPDADAVQSAMGQVARLLEQTPAVGTRFRVTLDWGDGTAVLALRPIVGHGQLPGVALGPGATARPWDHDALSDATNGDEVQPLALGVAQPPEAVLDVDAGAARLPAAREPFLTALAAMGTGLTGYSAEGCAAFAGAAAARQAEEDYRRNHSVDGPLSPREVAAAFVAYQEAIGGDFGIEEASPTHAVVSNHTCPFGAASVGAPHLCRITSAMLGSMAARNVGPVSVSLDERLAIGDRRCRLTLRAGATRNPANHRYGWPPIGIATAPSTGEPDGAHAALPSDGIGLSIQLPRDRVSVPIIRHVVRYALLAFGVATSAADDMELALSEACTNVLNHAGPNDVYEVALLFRDERCELRVIDGGRGFDHESVRARHVGGGAERGRGLTIMQAVMDAVDFESAPERGTLVTLVKQLEVDGTSPAWVLSKTSSPEPENRAYPPPPGGGGG